MESQKPQLTLFIFLLLAPLACLSSGLPGEYSTVSNDLHEGLTEEGITEVFKLWKEKHQKVYKHAEEAERRIGNFKRNLKYIIEKNGKRKSGLEHKVGLNKFADLSNEEFREMYLSKVKKPITIEEKRKHRHLQTCDAPSSLDWRNKGVVTAVKDQGDCGNSLFL
jgi:C1A family cysteine protease